MMKFEGSVTYLSDLSFQSEQTDLILLDEADFFIYENPKNFQKAFEGRTVIGFTATSKNQRATSLERQVLSSLGFKLASYHEDNHEDQGIPSIHEIVKFDSPEALKQFMIQRLSKRSLLLYCSVEKLQTLIGKWPQLIHFSADSSHTILHSLEIQNPNGLYQLLVITDPCLMRGIDPRAPIRGLD